jgi:hypothetical protein
MGCGAGGGVWAAVCRGAADDGPGVAVSGAGGGAGGYGGGELDRWADTGAGVSWCWRTIGTTFRRMRRCRWCGRIRCGAWPEIQVAMDRLAGKVSAEEVQAMNDAVDGSIGMWGMWCGSFGSTAPIIPSAMWGSRLRRRSCWWQCEADQHAGSRPAGAARCTASM